MQNIRSKQAQAKRDNKRMERDCRRNTEQMIPLLWRIQSISSISYLHLEDFRLDMVCQPFDMDPRRSKTANKMVRLLNIGPISLFIVCHEILHMFIDLLGCMSHDSMYTHSNTRALN